MSKNNYLNVNQDSHRNKFKSLKNDIDNDNGEFTIEDASFNNGNIERCRIEN